MTKKRVIFTLLMLMPFAQAAAGPHEIQVGGQLGLTMPTLGLSAEAGCSLRMDDTFGLDFRLLTIQGFGEDGIESLYGGTTGVTYQIDASNIIPFVRFGVGAGYLSVDGKDRSTLLADLGVGLLVRWRDRIDLGGEISKISDLGLSGNLSPPTRLDFVFRYRFER